MDALDQNYLESTRKLFNYYRQLGAKSIAQVDEKNVNAALSPESNSIAVIVKHLSGNMLSRWTDFLTSDGEKEWRNRDDEFEDTIDDLEQLKVVWDKGWDCLMNTMNSLQPDDVQQIIYIRNEGHTVMEAINRQVAHYAYHVGQLVFLAKHFAGESWQTLSIAKGKSSEFNKDKFDQDKGRRHFV